MYNQYSARDDRNLGARVVPDDIARMTESSNLSRYMSLSIDPDDIARDCLRRRDIPTLVDLIISGYSAGASLLRQLPKYEYALMITISDVLLGGVTLTDSERTELDLSNEIIFPEDLDREEDERIEERRQRAIPKKRSKRLPALIGRRPASRSIAD